MWYHGIIIIYSTEILLRMLTGKSKVFHSIQYMNSLEYRSLAASDLFRMLTQFSSIHSIVTLKMFQKGYPSNRQNYWLLLSASFTAKFELVFVLTLNDPSISESCIEIKIKLNFDFHTSLWSLKRFYEGL